MTIPMEPDIVYPAIETDTHGGEGIVPDTDTTEKPRTRRPAAPGPSHYTSTDLADAKGVSVGAISRALYRARIAVAAGGPRPVGSPPEPDEGSRPLRWSADRPDIKRWLADDTARVWR